MDIYGRELRETPPVDEWAAIYFGYERPGDDVAEGEPV